jgi:hypothetical protein
MPIDEFNYGLLRAPFGDPLVAEFTDNIDKVNAIAARSPGYVTRVAGYDDVLVAERLLADQPGARRLTLSTLSVWKDVASVRHFVLKTVHGHFLKRRADWVTHLDRPTYVLWPVDPGHVPDVHEAMERIEHLAAHGPGPRAFGFAWADEAVALGY